MTREQLAALCEAMDRPEVAMDERLVAFPPLLGRYEVREAIGAGGMGAVYKAWDRRLEAHVAVKIARASDGRNDVRLLREARAAAAVHHENVVGIRDVGEAEDGTPFVVMDFLEGEPLSSLLAERGRLPLPFALPLLEQVAYGLQAAHEAGIVHRDLKPSNVFVTERETGIRCTLIDFGLARAFDIEEETRSLTKDGQLVGTPRYMSPEQITGEHPVGPASDIYAWGCVAYHALSGTAPFGGTLHQLLHKHVHEEVSALDDVPPSIDALVRRCMHKDPSKRPASALELRTAMAVPTLRRGASRRTPLLALGGMVLALPLGWIAGQSQPAPRPLSAGIARVAVVHLAEPVACPPVQPPDAAVVRTTHQEYVEQEVAAVNANALAKPEPDQATETPRPKNPKRSKSKAAPKQTRAPKSDPAPASRKRSRAEILRELDGLD